MLFKSGGNCILNWWDITKTLEECSRIFITGSDSWNDQTTWNVNDVNTSRSWYSDSFPFHWYRLHWNASDVPSKILRNTSYVQLFTSAKKNVEECIHFHHVRFYDGSSMPKQFSKVKYHVQYSRNLLESMRKVEGGLGTFGTEIPIFIATHKLKHKLYKLFSSKQAMADL